MTWSTDEIEYEGLPLLLRRPDHNDIWKFKNLFPQLVSVEHHLVKLGNSGLPETKYNKTLADFDHHMCNLFSNSSDGLILLVETFVGKRNYYYYTKTEVDMTTMIEDAKKKYNVELTTWQKLDLDWRFLDSYPIDIYNK
jgi:hypothetical protein